MPAIAGSQVAANDVVHTRRMSTDTPHPNAPARVRRLRTLQLLFAGAAALALLALFDAARPDTTHTTPAAGSVRLTDGFAADGDDDQAQLQEQLALQQLQQSMQQAEQQNQEAQQQFEQAMQQAQLTEQQANNP